MKKLDCLIVDDDDCICELVTDLVLLANDEATIKVVNCVRDAREALRERDFDLIFCDICMPGADGTELLSYVKGKGIKNCTFSFISGIDDDYFKGAEQWSKIVKADKFFSKPFNTKEIVEWIRKAA